MYTRKFLIVSAVITLLMLVAHNDLGAVAEAEAELVSEEMGIDRLPPAYAFRAVDFDDAH